MGADRPVSSYVEHLPAILRQGPLVGRLLLAFEAILSGGVDAPDGASQPLPEGLEKILERADTFLDPSTTPEAFLPWLAQWAAASLRDDWSVETKRAFIGQIIPLYRMRGTRGGMEAVLRLVLGDVEVIELGLLDSYFMPLPFTLGSRPLHMPGIDEAVPPHHFLLVLRVAERDPIRLARTVQQVREIIDREKPAHTTYAMRIEYPAMKLTAEVKRDAHGTVVEGVVINESTVLGNTTANAALVTPPSTP
jgi:P2-related tail formation protein